MFRTPRFSFLCFVALLLGTAPAKADAPDEAEVRKLVEQLAGDSAKARAEAARKLTAQGTETLRLPGQRFQRRLPARRHAPGHGRRRRPQRRPARRLLPAPVGRAHAAATRGCRPVTGGRAAD